MDTKYRRSTDCSSCSGGGGGGGGGGDSFADPNADTSIDCCHDHVLVVQVLALSWHKPWTKNLVTLASFLSRDLVPSKALSKLNHE